MRATVDDVPTSNRNESKKPAVNPDLSKSEGKLFRGEIKRVLQGFAAAATSLAPPISRLRRRLPLTGLYASQRHGCSSTAFHTRFITSTTILANLWVPPLASDILTLLTMITDYLHPIRPPLLKLCDAEAEISIYDWHPIWVSDS